MEVVVAFGFLLFMTGIVGLAIVAGRSNNEEPEDTPEPDQGGEWWEW